MAKRERSTGHKLYSSRTRDIERHRERRDARQKALFVDLNAEDLEPEPVDDGRYLQTYKRDVSLVDLLSDVADFDVME